METIEQKEQQKNRERLREMTVLWTVANCTKTNFEKSLITSLPVGICLASFTLAKFPLPMVFSNRYFPMCGSSEVRLEELRIDADALPEPPPPPPPPPLLPSDPLNWIKIKETKSLIKICYNRNASYFRHSRENTIGTDTRCKTAKQEQSQL